MPTDGGAEPDVLFVDAACLREEHRCQRGRVGVVRQASEDVEHALHRPSQIHGGRPRAGQQLAAGEHVGTGLVWCEPVANRLTGRHGNTVGPGDADRGGTTHPQRLDRLHQGVDIAAGNPLKPGGQEGLVEQFKLAMPAKRSWNHRWGHRD